MAEFEQVRIIGVIPHPADTCGWSKGKLFPVKLFRVKNENEVWDKVEEHPNSRFLFDSESGRAIMYPSWAKLPANPQMVTGDGSQFLNLMVKRDIIALFQEDRRN